MTQPPWQVAFDAAACNQDYHSKNSTCMLEDGDQWMLDPDCDLTFVGNQDSPWNKAHSMSVNGNFDGSVGVDWLSITDCHSIARARCAFEEVKHAVRDCSKYARVARIGAKETQRMGRLHTGPW